MHSHDAILFLYALLEGRAVRNASPLSIPNRYRRCPPPSLFAAVDGISCQLELDLSNSRVIALGCFSFFARSSSRRAFSLRYRARCQSDKRYYWELERSVQRGHQVRREPSRLSTWTVSFLIPLWDDHSIENTVHRSRLMVDCFFWSIRGLSFSGKHGL